MKRYVLEADKFIIEEEFGVQADSESLYEPNYNVIWGTNMPVIIQKDEEREIVNSVWGLKLNEESEERAEVPQQEIPEDDDLSALIESKPCVIPVSGFYKWKESVDDPLPFYLRVINREVTAVAGMYNIFTGKGGRTEHTFSVITMPANPLVEPLDDRMPVILSQKEIDQWLGGDAQKLIEKGFSGNHLLPDMTVFRVPELVNDPSNNSKELIQPIPKLRNYDGAEED